jgi:CRP-like cAMP-binding protein
MPSELKTELKVVLKEDLVLSVPLFRGLSATTLLKIVRALQPIISVPGALITQVGQRAQHMYFLNRGSVGVYVIDDSGTEKLVSTRQAGFHFGESDFFGEQRRVATVKALSFCELDTLSYECIETIMHRNADLRQVVQASAKQVYAQMHMMKRELDQERAGKKLKAMRKSLKHTFSTMEMVKSKRKMTGLFSEPTTDHQQERELKKKQKSLADRHVKRLNKKYDSKKAEAFGRLIHMARTGSEKDIGHRASLAFASHRKNARTKRTQVAPTEKDSSRTDSTPTRTVEN